MLETYDPKWAEKNDHAQAEYQRLGAIPLQERTADDLERMKALAAVQGLSFMAQFKTPNAYIRFHYDTLYKNLLRQYGELD